MIDHAAVLGRVLYLNGMVDSTQSKACNARAVVFQPAELALDQRHFDFVRFSHDLTQDLFDRFTALRSDSRRRVDIGQAVDGGTHDVDRVA